MSVQPFGFPLFRWLDANGAPLAGGLLYTYAGGTSTPLTTYTDATGAVANANPVVLDSTGTAQVWLSPGVLYKFVLTDSAGVLQWNVDFFPSPSSSTVSTSAVVNDPGGRLTLSATLPVSTSDVTGQVVVYYLPYKSDQVPLYNGTSWSLYAVGAGGLFQALSDTFYSPAAAAANKCYDLFLWLNGSTVTLSRGPAWTSDTVRGTGAGTSQLNQLNGRWVNGQNITNGPAVNMGLYVGTIRTDGSALANDSLAKRHCWNNYNRATRPMVVTDSTASWAYTTAAFRQANANAANQLDFVIGLLEEEVTASVVAGATSSSGTPTVLSGIGVDSSTSGTGSLRSQQVLSSAGISGLSASYRGFPGIGRHYLAWLELGAANVTFWSLAAGTGTVAGISGEVRG